jgi:hypothetical protein
MAVEISQTEMKREKRRKKNGTETIAKYVSYL